MSLWLGWMMNVWVHIWKGPDLRRYLSGFSLVDGNFEQLDLGCLLGSSYATESTPYRKYMKMLRSC